MPYIAGLKANDGYLFFVNNITDDPRKNGSVVELSNYCGALLLTSSGEQLQRLKKVLDRCMSGVINKKDDLSDDIIEKIITFLTKEFQEDTSYKAMPLTFLLLVVGTNRKQQGRFEHVYIRNRVSEKVEKEGRREYITTFDIEPAKPADNIFYGESDIIQYLSQMLPSRSFPVRIVKELACLSIAEFSYKNEIPSSDIEMAALSAEKGFVRIKDEELVLLFDKSKNAHSALVDGLNRFLSLENADA